MKNIEPMVSIICTSYNHEKYIRQCLDGFIMQKTDFPFEVLIHDDASTDGTADIIREYESLYPNIIKPIYQKENQYSKGIRIFSTFILPLVKGKYLAFCEGDDYWCDIDKLQKQIDFLECHSDYSACVHNTEVLYLSNGKNIVQYGDKDKDLELTDCVYEGGQSFHTSSIMYRSKICLKPPAFTTMMENVGVGDYPIAIYLALVGKIHYFGKVMSVYRCGTEYSWTNRMKGSEKKRILLETSINMLYAADKYSKNQYRDIFFKAINKRKYNLYKLNLDFKSIIKDKENFNKESREFKIMCFLYAYFPLAKKIWHYFKGVLKNDK